jgi:hypothetical protein
MRMNVFTHGSSRGNARNQRKHTMNMIEAEKTRGRGSDVFSLIVFCLFCTHKKLYKQTS